MGVSYCLKVSKVTVKSLITILKEILSNSAMHQKAQVISQELIAEADGGEVASEALIQFIMSGCR